VTGFSSYDGRYAGARERLYHEALGTLCCVTADAIDFACLHNTGLALRWRLLERSEGVMCQFVGESNMSSVKWKVRAGLDGERCASFDGSIGRDFLLPFNEGGICTSSCLASLLTRAQLSEMQISTQRHLPRRKSFLGLDAIFDRSWRRRSDVASPHGARGGLPVIFIYMRPADADAIRRRRISEDRACDMSVMLTLALLWRMWSWGPRIEDHEALRGEVLN
jgi:hypothetical protein